MDKEGYIDYGCGCEGVWVRGGRWGDREVRGDVGKCRGMRQVGRCREI